jgi:hypothetical protein
MVADRASGIRHDVQQLIQMQIDTLNLDSSLTPSQLLEYQSRAQMIKTLYEELDQIGRDRLALSTR